MMGLIENTQACAVRNATSPGEPGSSERNYAPLTKRDPDLLGLRPACKRPSSSMLDPLLDTKTPNILLRGQTGSGKDAMPLHPLKTANRSEHNFVGYQTCGAVPETW